MSGLLNGKSVLMTGAASGIGLATARLAAREGARVVLCDRNEEQGAAAGRSSTTRRSPVSSACAETRPTRLPSTGWVGLTRSAAGDYAAQGVRINAICPGFVDTPLTASAFEQSGAKILAAVPARRLGTPEEIAEVVVWLLSDRSSFVTGAAIAADGGYTAL